jgi:peptide/nickel transport system permease protein
MKWRGRPVAATPLAMTMRRFSIQPLAAGALALLIGLSLAVAAAPLLAHLLDIDANAIDLFNRFAAASADHPLGTDELGRDVLLRLLQGGRASLLVGVAAAITAATIGTAVGLAAGYFGGTADALLMRIADGFMALPLLPLLIVLAAIDPAKIGIAPDVAASPIAGVLRIIVIISLVGWTGVARLVRAEALHLREEPFVLAARAQGAGTARILVVHILPNLASSIIVATTLAAGNIILLESVLSFLGLGIQPPTPSWGNLLTNAQELIWVAPALAIYPGSLILLTVVALNVVGDGLREALDPRAAKS